MSEHWYSRDGAPAYEVPNKSAGGMRPTTVRDARALGLVPSVTTVLAVKAKPNLEVWKVRQGILAALTLPRVEGEPEDAWLQRIEADSREQAKKAAEEGTRIHDAIERSFKGMYVPSEYQPHVDGVRAELARIFPTITDWVAEASFAHEDGYGGKVDLHSPSTGIVVDFKGKDFGPEDAGKRMAYDQNEQLGAYQRGLGFQPAEGANLFVSRTHPGLVAGHVWKADEMREGAETFACCLRLWMCIRKFNPSFLTQAAA